MREDGLAARPVVPVGHDHVERHADADAGVGDVEGREAVIRQVDVDEVDDVVAEEAVADVAEGAADATARLLAAQSGVAEISRRGDVFDFAITGDYAPILATLGTLPVVDLLSRAADLDEVFLDLYRGNGA